MFLPTLKAIEFGYLGEFDSSFKEFLLIWPYVFPEWFPLLSPGGLYQPPGCSFIKVLGNGWSPAGNPLLPDATWLPLSLPSLLSP